MKNHHNIILASRHSNISSKAALRSTLLASTILLTPMHAFAQDVEQNTGQPAVAEEEEVIENEIIVRGEIARTIESSLETKRQLNVIGDAIVGDDIGDLPDLSVAETLERIVGVSADRFRGQSQEISIRGLGAFLGASFINGREVTSGSDGRDVSFSQFPSELVNGAIVYKTQQASFIEGGVSGIVELQTLRPLDFGRRRITIQGQLGYSDYENRIVGGDDVSERLTISYIDQYDLGGAGELGIAIGGQIRRDTAPEDAFFASSSFRPCNTIEGVDGNNDCAFLTDADGNPNGASETFFVSNQYQFRALQESQTDRDALIGAIQWRPSPNWEVNIDGQYSVRNDEEDRANLIIADGRRDITPIEISAQGALLAFTGESRVETQSTFRSQDEEFIGVGGNVKFDNGRYALAADVAYSQTTRRRDDRDLRIRTNQRVIYQLDFRDVEAPALTFLDVSAVENNTGLTFDLNNFDIFDNAARARRQLENVDDDIFSVRLDGSVYLDNFFTTIDTGFRYSQRNRVRDDGIDNNNVALLPGGFFTDAAIAARNNVFPVRDFLTGANTGGITQGLTFATFDTLQLFNAVTGSDDAGLPVGSSLSPEDTDVSEEIYAGYVQANFDTELFGTTATGNFGIRAVRTNVTSLGISSDLITEVDQNDPTIITVTPVGPAVINEERNGFWSFLPSANISFNISNDKILRLAAYRAIARPDQEGLSAALRFDDTADLDNIGSIVSASGNPQLEPLSSWNADLSFEWYASATSSLFLTAYYKNLQTGIETDIDNLTVNVDGVPTDIAIARSVNSNDSSTIFGFEISLNHSFDYLPSPFDGFGIQANYNFADSNFEFPDPTITDGVNALADFTTPANISGFSRHTGNANLFYEKGPVSLRLAYRYRSEFFRPFRSDSNRFNEGNGFLDFSASFNILKDVQFRLQALNLTDEPIIQNRPTNDSRAEASFSGRRYFAGLRLRF